MSCPPQLTTIGDPGLIEQACFNLLSNAAAHTDTGTITIDAELAGTGCTITITDTGSGIAPEESERIFERFYRAGEPSHDGFGLGLAIARSCANALGGELEIASSPGLGTVAVVTLPAGLLAGGQGEHPEPPSRQQHEEATT